MRLAVRDGLSHLTTEAIAREAGISVRTFFNYYPYKEAALMGPPPDYPAEAAEAFVAGRGRLLDDLNLLIAQHLRRFLDEREMLAHLYRLADQDPKLNALRQNSLLTRHAHMAELMRRRLGRDVEPVMIEILSSSVVSATAAATRDWAAGRVTDFIEAAQANLNRIVPAGQLLLSPGPDP